MSEDHRDAVTKLGAANQLLNAAIEMLLDRRDYLSAIVLAGAAEDLFQGQLKRGNREHAASRSQLAAATIAMGAHLYPESALLAPNEAFGMMRDVVNWLKHDDGGDALERRLDWRKEATHLCMRAVDNHYEVSGQEHPRAKELGYPVGNHRPAEQ